MKRGIGWTWLLGILLGMVPGSSALAGPDTGSFRHVLSLRVLVDGEVVMSPNLRLRPGVPASIALAGESGEPGYALQVRLSADPDRPGSYSTLEATLWKGDYQRERPLLNTRVVLDRQRIDKAMPIASVRSRDGRSVELQVISHAQVLPGTTTPLARPMHRRPRRRRRRTARRRCPCRRAAGVLQCLMWRRQWPHPALFWRRAMLRLRCLLLECMTVVPAAGRLCTVDQHHEKPASGRHHRFATACYSQPFCRASR